MIVFLIALIFILLAHVLRSTFVQIMAGLVTIAAGVNWITIDVSIWTYIVLGTAIIALGLYELIMVAVDFFKGG